MARTSSARVCDAAQAVGVFRDGFVTASVRLPGAEKAAFLHKRVQVPMLHTMPGRLNPGPRARRGGSARRQVAGLISRDLGLRVGTAYRRRSGAGIWENVGEKGR